MRNILDASALLAYLQDEKASYTVVIQTFLVHDAVV